MPMTEEHKQKMAEGRRRAKEQREAEAQAEQLREEHEAEMAAQQAKAEGVTEPVKVTHEETGYDEDGEIEYVTRQEWGPHQTFMEMDTPYGLYGLPKDTIMWFQPAEKKLPNGEIIDSHDRVMKNLKTGVVTVG